MSDSHDSVLQELVEKSYEVMSEGDVGWHLVKYDNYTTAFVHFTSVAIVAYKIAQLIRGSQNRVAGELIERIESEVGMPFEKYCFLVGLVHDYEKVSSHPMFKSKGTTFADYVLGRFGVSDSIKQVLKQDAKSCEEGVSSAGGKHHDLVASICRLADILASQDNVVDARKASEEVSRKILAPLGLTLGILHVNSHRLFLVLRSKKLVELLQSKGWQPLLAYRDGVIFIGSKSASKVTQREISEKIKEGIAKLLYEKHKVATDIAGSVTRGLTELVGYISEALAAELPLSEDDEERERNYKLLANRISKAVKEQALSKQSIGKIVEEITGDLNKQSIQKSLLPPARKVVENVVKEAPSDILLSILDGWFESLRSQDANKEEVIAKMVYLVVGWSKDESKVANAYRAVFNEPPPKGILNIAVATLLKVFDMVESGRVDDLERMYKSGFASILGATKGELDLEVEYFTASYISGDIIVKEALGRDYKKERRCVLCRSPIFTDDPMQIEEYGKTVAGGAVGGVQQIWINDDIPFIDKDEYTQTTKEPSKYLRPMCMLCKYEASVIGKATPLQEGKLSVPFIAIYFRPAISIELLSFIASKVYYGLQGKSLRDIYSEEFKPSVFSQSKSSLPYNVVVNYLGAYIVYPYKDNNVPMENDRTEQALAYNDLSGKLDQVFYGLLLVPALAKITKGGQFKICLSTVDLLSPPEKLVEIPRFVRFVEELNDILMWLRFQAKRRQDLKEVFDRSYYYFMKALEGVAIRAALWYDQTNVSSGKRGKPAAARWLIRAVRDAEELPIHVALLTPPPTGFDVMGKRDPVKSREDCRSRFSEVWEISREIETFLSPLIQIHVGDAHVR